MLSLLCTHRTRLLVGRRNRVVDVDLDAGLGASVDAGDADEGTRVAAASTSDVDLCA
jgi:hypothetical protein